MAALDAFQATEKGLNGGAGVLTKELGF